MSCVNRVDAHQVTFILYDVQNCLPAGLCVIRVDLHFCMTGQSESECTRINDNIFLEINF